MFALYIAAYPYTYCRLHRSSVCTLGWDTSKTMDYYLPRKSKSFTKELTLTQTEHPCK